MRYYPWVIRSGQTRAMESLTTESQSAAQNSYNSLLPQSRGGLDVAKLQAGLGIGAQVGLRRNLEFTAGGRAHRISTGSYTTT